jgi:transcriptional regulator with XRE-family HTH domain
MPAKLEGRENEPDGPANGLEAFALELKAQREAAGLTQEQLAKLMGYSASVIAKLETCRTVPSPQHADRADEALKMPGTFRRLRKATINGTYEPWFQPYLDIEERATVLRSWQPLVVDGLLQTEAYARGVLRGARPTDSDAMIDQLVTARMSRQEIWDRKDPEPPVLSVILAESVLRQRVGDAQVMQEQLGRLVGTAENPRITTQIMPSLANAHPGLLGPFVVASFENSPDAAYLDNALDGQVTERRAQVAQVALLYETLRSEALSPGASTELIMKVADETWRM